MKPVVIVSGDFVRTGGQDMANFALASYLLLQGGEVALVSHRVEPDLLVHKNLKVHLVRKPLNSYLLGAPLIRRAGQRVGGSVLSRGGQVVVNGGNCDLPAVNWVHYVHAAYCPAPNGSYFRRVKQRYTASRQRREESIAFNVARRFVANSNRTRRDIIVNYGIDEGTIDVVYYGIDATRFYPASETDRDAKRRQLGWPAEGKYVAFIGALGDRRKGFDTLFQAWREFACSGDFGVTLVVVGRGAELHAWRRRAEEARIDSSIKFLGFRSDVHEILRACDALIAPTRYEAYGLGVHEAICCGIPAFVSKDAGIAERYPQDLTELLLPDPNDALDLAARLLRWREDVAGWRRRVAPFGEMLRARSWDDMAADIVRVMQIGV